MEIKVPPSKSGTSLCMENRYVQSRRWAVLPKLRRILAGNAASLPRRLAALSAGIWVSVLVLSCAAAQAQQTPASTAKTCNYPGGPTCPSAPPMIGPWQYVVDPHYDGLFPNA